MLHEVASNVTDLASRHIWSSSRTCRRCPPGLWPSYREGVALQTTETCSPAPFENTSDTTISVYSPLAFRILPLSYHRSLPDTVMALCVCVGGCVMCVSDECVCIYEGCTAQGWFQLHSNCMLGKWSVKARQNSHSNCLLFLMECANIHDPLCGIYCTLWIPLCGISRPMNSRYVWSRGMLLCLGHELGSKVQRCSPAVHCEYCNMINGFVCLTFMRG